MTLVICLLNVPADMTHTKDTLAYRIQISALQIEKDAAIFCRNREEGCSRIGFFISLFPQVHEIYTCTSVHRSFFF